MGAATKMFFAGGGVDLAAAYAAEVMADSPVAYWRLGEASGTTAEDETGSHNGTYAGSPTLGATGIFAGDSAAGFNGSTQYVSKTGISISPVFPMTIEAWIKKSSFTRSEVIAWAGRNGHTQWTANYIVVSALGMPSVSTANNNTFAAAASATACVTNQWHHVVGVFASATSRTIYVDGVSQGTNATNLAPSQIDSFLAGSPGQTSSPENSRLTGNVDEVAFYTTALSAARIAAHYSAAGY